MKGWIYFLQFGRKGPIKVGKSYNPVARARDLNMTMPVELVLLGAVRSRNALREESTLHNSLRKFHVRGEWYARTAVLAKMKKLGARVKADEELLTALHGDSSTGRDVRVNLRMSTRLFDLIQKAAKQDRRSFNSMFEIIVSEWVAKHPKPNKGRP